MFSVVPKLRAGLNGRAGEIDPKAPVHTSLPLTLSQIFQNVHLDNAGAPGMLAVSTSMK